MSGIRSPRRGTLQKLDPLSVQISTIGQSTKYYFATVRLPQKTGSKIPGPSTILHLSFIRKP